MKRLVVLLLLFTPWVMHPMEPEEVTAKVPEELKLETLAKRYLEGKEEELPGPLPDLPSQIIAQKLLSQGPIKRFILSQVFLPFKDFVNPTGMFYSVEFNSTRDEIVTGSSDGTAKIWDSKTFELLYTLGDHTDRVISAVFNPKGDKVATGFSDGTAKIWGVKKGDLLQTLEGKALIHSVAFDPTGNKIVITPHGFNVQIRDVNAGNFLLILRGHTAAVISAVFSPKGDKVATGSWDNTAKIWSVKKGDLLQTLEGQAPIHSVAFDPTGNKVVITPQGRTAQIWDVNAGNLLRTLRGHTEAVISAVFSPTGDKVVTGSKDGITKMWNVETGELIYTLKGPANLVDAAVNPAGDKVAVVTRHEVRTWDLEPFLSREEFLARAITLRQMVILNAILEVMKARGIVKALGEKAFERGAPILSSEEITFDFNRYLPLWDAYKSLPEAIRRIFDWYVTKLSSSAQKQAPFGS